MSDFDHTTIVVFGASGDLAKKMTYPAIYSLTNQPSTPLETSSLHVIGTARSKYSKSEFADKMRPGLEAKDKKNVDKFLERCSYVALKGYDDTESFGQLDKAIAESEPKGKRSLRLFYIALPPSAFEDVARNVRAKAWKSDDGVTSRIIVEKPYGKDTESAKKLSKELEKSYSEEELYRIDHYLGKESVKCVLPLRFGSNPSLSATWSREHISHVTVDFKEEFGAEGRGGYFDEFGMIRDVMQNHLMQWIVLLGMEQPKSLSAEDIHTAKLNFIKECRPIKPEDVLVAQYTESKKDPKEKKAYVDDETVKDDSKAATYATAILYVDNPRWKDVPFIIRAGKALDETRAEFTLNYKTQEKSLFATPSAPSTFTVRDHPERSHVLTLITKRAGSGFKITPAPLALQFSAPETSDDYVPTAYESLIEDAVRGDHTWFLPREEAEAGWRVWDEAIAGTKDRQPVKYAYGASGVEQEEKFLEQRVDKKAVWGTKADKVVDVAERFGGLKI